VIQLASWYQRKLRCLDRFDLGRKSGEKAANPLHGVIYTYTKSSTTSRPGSIQILPRWGAKDLLSDMVCCEESSQAETYSIVMVRYLVALWDVTADGYEPSNPGWPTLYDTEEQHRMHPHIVENPKILSMKIAS